MDDLRDAIRKRAGGRCEYCRFPDSYAYYDFQIDHIIAQKHEGATQIENLAWSCLSCNAHKGSNIAGWVDERQQVIRLFHPRRDNWDDHFEWRGAVLVPKTTIGRVTIHVLQINALPAIAARRALLRLGEALS